MSKTTTLNNLFKITASTKASQRFFQGDDGLEPSALTIANILNYSKALSIRNNNLLGKIELVLN